MDIHELWCIWPRTSKLVDIHKLGPRRVDVTKAQEAVVWPLAEHRSDYPEERLALAVCGSASRRRRRESSQ
jgi:hypothetical protein